jgi:2-phospho-L-lactate/phosphoenolpyruvate guanylyltransferase
MKPWAVIPVKSFALAKSRLAHLSADRRAALARSMFEHVIDVLRAGDDMEGIAVLTNDDHVAAAARDLGAEVVRDPAPPVSGAARPALGRVVDAALDRLAARGVPAALVLMSDLPRLHARAVAALVARMRDHQVVIAPDLREQGTNALGLSPPDCIRTCFGHGDSLHRHLAAARGRGLGHVVHRDRALGLDIDLPADLALYESRTDLSC